jgi:uncharacterized membrane protein
MTVLRPRLRRLLLPKRQIFFYSALVSLLLPGTRAFHFLPSNGIRPSSISTRPFSKINNKLHLPLKAREKLNVLHIGDFSNSAPPGNTELAFWIFAFAATHIGLSAVRSRIITILGDVTEQAGLVGNKGWKLAEYWPSDSSGNAIFPDTETTGRQLYRVVYTSVAFVTLASALQCYMTIHASSANVDEPPTNHSLAFQAAVFSNTAAFASLANASPLGLMPSFSPGTPQSTMPLQRDDARKLTAYGLTRITRHPLILPVVPWGIANALVGGGEPEDWLFFGGLSLYSLLGCWAQDLRVIKQEGSVGTTFLSNGSVRDEQQDLLLQKFYQSTSFVPFAAIVDGRQSIQDTLTEVPWWSFLIAWPVGHVVEEAMVRLLKAA